MRKTLILSMTIIALLVAGCGGGDKKADSESSSSNESSSKESNSSDSGGTSSGSDEFDKLVEKYKKEDFKVTYREADGEEWTFVQDGKGKAAYIREDNATYYDGEKLTTCTGTGADLECTSVKGENSFYALGPFTAWGGIVQSLKSIPGVKSSSDRVAGRDVKCVTWDPGSIAKAFGGDAGGAAGSTLCADAKTGVIMKIDDKSSPDSNLEAVSFGTSSPNDLEAPKTTATTMPADSSDDNSSDTSD